MTSISNNVLPQYLGNGDPALKDYFPVWVNNIAADATVEGSMLNGAVQGADAVRSVVLTIRPLYEQQEFKFAGPYGDNGFIEHYIAKVNGEPIGCVVLIAQCRRPDAARCGQLPALQLGGALFTSPA
jgi:hypothetical protein